MTRPITILYIEDEENDVFFLKRAFKQAGLSHSVRAVPDGAQAVKYLAGLGIFADRTQHPFPDLILMDINMPKQSGLEVLEWVRRDLLCKSLPTVILTSSSRPGDVEKAYRLGVDDYMLKPSNPLELVAMMTAIHTHWLSKPIPSKVTPAGSISAR